MERSITPSLTSSVSSNSARELTFAHSAALLTIGALFAGVHQGWDVRLHLPGHYGLIWMAGVMLTRQSSQATWAATITALGYVSGTLALSGWAHHASTQAPLYALSTLAVDVAWRMSAVRCRPLALAGLVGGLAFLLKPLAQYAFASGVDIEVGALQFGPWFPLLTHFCFGATGAIIGTLLARAKSIDPQHFAH